MRKRKLASRVLVPLAAAGLLLCVCVPALAATTRADGCSGERTLYDNYGYGQDGDPEAIEVLPGEEIRIPLTADLFTFSDGKVPVNLESLSLRELGRVKVRTQTRSASETLDYVQLDVDTFPGAPFITGTERTGRTAYISVMFAKRFPSVEERDFEYNINLVVDGRTYDELSITVAGTMMTDEFSVYGGDDHIDLEEGMVAEAVEPVRDIRVDAGNGIALHTTLHKGDKCYATSQLLESQGDVTGELALFATGEETAALYPDIVCVYRLETLGFRRGSTKVTFDGHDGLYVYGEELEYLGTTGDELTLSGYYFLAQSRLAQLADAAAPEYAYDPGGAPTGETAGPAGTRPPGHEPADPVIVDAPVPTGRHAGPPTKVATPDRIPDPVD